MNINELIKKFREGGIDYPEEDLKNLLKRALTTGKLCYIKDKNKNIIGFFSWEKVVYMNSMVMFKGYEKSMNFKKIKTFIANENKDCDTVYWKNKKTGNIKIYKLRSY